MSDEKKTETGTFEPWENDERQGLVDMMAMAITLSVASNPRIRTMARTAVEHLRETHGFTEGKGREETLRIQADALRLIAKSITSGIDIYGGGDSLLNGVLGKGSEKGN